MSDKEAALEQERGELGGVAGSIKSRLFGRFTDRPLSVSGGLPSPKGVEAALVSRPRSQVWGSYTEAEMPRSCKRRTRPREVLVVLVESRRLVEDSARDRERDSRRGVQMGV